MQPLLLMGRGNTNITLYFMCSGSLARKQKNTVRGLELQNFYTCLFFFSTQNTLLPILVGLARPPICGPGWVTARESSRHGSLAWAQLTHSAFHIPAVHGSSSIHRTGNQKNKSIRSPTQNTGFLFKNPILHERLLFTLCYLSCLDSL